MDSARLRASGLTDDAGGNTGNRGVVRHVLQHDRPRRDARAMADADVAQDLGPCPDQDAVLDLRVAVAVFLAGAAQCHGMQHRDVVADDGGFPDDDGMGMVDHDPLADPGIGMDVDAEGLADPHLDEVGHVAPAGAPQPVPDAIGLHGLIALEEQDGLEIAVAGRIAFVDGHQVGPGRGTKVGLVGIGLVGDFAEDLLAHLAAGKLQREAVGKRPLQRGMVEKTRMDERAKQRLGPDGGLGLFADARPDRIDGSQFVPWVGHGATLFQTRSRTVRQEAGVQGAV